MSPIVPRGAVRHRRSLPRVGPEFREPSEDIESPLPNAWPMGVRTMGCLACDAPFVSSGRQERLCPSCRRHQA
jgi:hypothetical protein